MTQEGNEATDEGAPAPRRRGARGLRARMRRRRVVAAAGLMVLLGVGILVGVLAGGDGSPHKRASLDDVAPGLAKKLGVPTVIAGAASKLPLRRQVAQLVLVGHDGSEPLVAAMGAVQRDGLGGVVLAPGAELATAGVRDASARARNAARLAHAPAPLLAVDQPGGPSSALPLLPPRAQPLVGDSGRPADALAEAVKAGRLLRAVGVSLTIAPAADVGTVAGPVEDRVFGDDTGVVTRMTSAAVNGYRAAGLPAAVGHFPGEGAAQADPDLATATVGLGLDELRARDLRPFAAVMRRAPVVVVSNAVYAAYDGVTPAVMLPEIVTGLLRKEMRFKGIVMTDDLAATVPVAGEPVGRVAVETLEAGTDLIYVSGAANAHVVVEAVTAAVRSGRISRDRLQASVLRVLALKRRAGLAIVAPVVKPRKPVRRTTTTTTQK